MALDDNSIGFSSGSGSVICRLARLSFVIYHQSIRRQRAFAAIGASCRVADAGLSKREGGMKHYVGDRTIDGVKVTVDGAPLDPALKVMEFTKNGFEWSYEGPEPRQLALALLVDHLGDTGMAKSLAEPFMRTVVANFGNEWEMNSSDIDLAVTALPGKAVA
jgi:Family of unknown function (DUF6166)